MRDMAVRIAASGACVKHDNVLYVQDDRRLSGGVMSNDTMTCWTVSGIQGHRHSVRSFLAQRGMKKGDFSKFIEDAVKWRVLDQTMAEARGQFADLSADALDSLLDEAVTATRQADAPKAR